jgi:hypothetical protein
MQRIDKIANDIAAMSAVNPEVCSSCRDIPQLATIGWDEIRRHVSSGLYDLNGFSWGLSKIESMLFPRIDVFFGWLYILIPITAGFIFQSWWSIPMALCMLAAPFIMAFLDRLTILIAFAAFIWAVTKNNEPILLCALGILCGCIIKHYRSGYKRVYRALLKREELFAFFFKKGSFWIIDNQTGKIIDTTTPVDGL